MSEQEFDSVRGESTSPRQRHYEGWDKALDDAITRFETANQDSSGAFEAELKLTIKFYKQSPGWVGEYRIDLDHIHQPPS